MVHVGQALNWLRCGKQTLVGYLKRFGRCIRKAFPGARQNDQRDYIDSFIAGALENHVNFLDRIKNSEHVRNSQERD